MAQYIITNQPEPVDFEIDNDDVGRTLQNCKNLLMTRMGEVPYDRLRGFDHALFHLPMEEMRAALLPEINRLMLWEPDVAVISATATPTRSGEIVVETIVEIEFED